MSQRQEEGVKPTSNTNNASAWNIFAASGDSGSSWFGEMQAAADEAVALTDPRKLQWKLLHEGANIFFTEAQAASETSLADFKKYCDDGHWTWRILGFLCGILLVVTSVLSLIYHGMSFQAPPCFGDVAILLFGQLMIFIEYKKDVIPKFIMETLREEARFIFRPYGRSYLYVFFGIFLMTQAFSPEGWTLDYDCLVTYFYIISGIVSFVVGVIIGTFSHIAEIQLAKLKKERKFTEEQLSVFFSKCNTTGWDFTLTTEEFIEFTKYLGLKMNYNEIDITLIEIDDNFDGQIDFKEFMVWYNRLDESEHHGCCC